MCTIVQDCYIDIHMPWWFTVFIPPSSTLGVSPNAIPSQSPETPSIPPLVPHPPRGLDVWCSLSCVHVFSLFSTHLWVRTCCVWFSVLGSVCWEWWFPGSSTSWQRTRTHHFWWLHSIPWCICATFSQSSLSSMGIWVGSRSLLWYTVLQWTFVCMCPYSRMIYSPLDIYPEHSFHGCPEYCKNHSWLIKVKYFVILPLFWTIKGLKTRKFHLSPSLLYGIAVVYFSSLSILSPMWHYY